jgi:hypothetical protein
LSLVDYAAIAVNRECGGSRRRQEEELRTSDGSYAIQNSDGPGWQKRKITTATLTPAIHSLGVDRLTIVGDTSNLLDGSLAIAICISFVAVTAAQQLLRIFELAVEFFEQLLIISIYNIKSIFSFFSLFLSLTLFVQNRYVLYRILVCIVQSIAREQRLEI